MTSDDEAKKIQTEVERLSSETLDTILRTIQAGAHRTVVHEATLKALIARHSDPAAVRLAAESILAQTQTGVAQRGVDARGLGDLFKPILDGLFAPPILLQPDEDC